MSADIAILAIVCLVFIILVVKTESLSARIDRLEDGSHIEVFKSRGS